MWKLLRSLPRSQLHPKSGQNITKNTNQECRRRLWAWSVLTSNEWIQQHLPTAAGDFNVWSIKLDPSQGPWCSWPYTCILWEDPLNLVSVMSPIFWPGQTLHGCPFRNGVYPDWAVSWAEMMVILPLLYKPLHSSGNTKWLSSAAQTWTHFSGVWGFLTKSIS